MKSCRLSLPLPLCSRRHPAAGLSRREPLAALSPVRVRTTRAARLRSCFSVAAVLLAAGVLSGLPAAPTASAQAAAVTGKIFWGQLGANGDCAAPGCTNEATVSDFSFTVEVESVAAAEGSANGGKIGCPHGCTPIITFAAKVALTDSSMQLVAQDSQFNFVVVFRTGFGGVGSPPPATYRFGLCQALVGTGYLVQGAEGTGASVQLVEQCYRIGATFNWPAPTGSETVVYPQGVALPSPPASASASASAEAGPLRSAVAGTGGGAAELSLTGTSAAADDVLTSYSITTGGNLCTGKTGSCTAPSPLTATMGFDPVSTTQFMTAGLEVSQWRTALVTPRGQGTTLAYQFEYPALVSYTATTGTGGGSVQAVFWSTGTQPPSAVTAPVTPKPGGSGWGADATRFAHQAGKLFSYLCPPNGTENSVWGTTTYTDDSSVCTAAVNYGLITFESGGTVTIEMRAGLASYTGSNRNGTTTESSGHSTGSFVFIGQPIYNTDVGYGGRGWDAYPSSFPAKNGQRYLYICPPKGSPAEIFGTGTYTTDSPVCTAAVQEGLITLAKGGYVTIEIKPGIGTYTGSTKNGITSTSGTWSYGSYIFVTTLQPLG